MKISRLYIAAACGLLMLSGCKPTEKNYQDAYLAAQNKRKADKSLDKDMRIPAGALQSFDGVRKREVNGEQLRVKHVFIKYAGKGEALAINRYNVAVAKYKMPTNVLAQAEDLVAASYQAFPAEGADGNFYVIAGSFPALEEAAEFVKDYKKRHEAAQFVGLDGDILVIER